MFAMSVRVRPCSARSSPRSVGRVTVIIESSCAICIRCGTSWRSSPRGPDTVTRPGSTETRTPAGTSMGLLPIRDMVSQRLRLPDETDDFAADAFLLGGSARRDSPGGGDDREAQTGEDSLAA